MLGNPSAPSGPRPAIHNPPSPTKTENRIPATAATRGSRIAVGREPPPVPSKPPSYTPVTSNYGLPNYASATGESSQTNGTTDFLPTLSFDELHSSIIPSADDFAADFFSEISKEPMETGTMIVERSAAARPHTMETGGMDHTTTNGARAIPTRTRAGSLITRRQSLTNRQASISSMTSGIGGPSTGADGSNVTTRVRRTQYPPISSNNTSKGPRKSLLSSSNGGIDGDSARAAQRRRPSLINSVGATPSAPIQSMSDVHAAGRAMGATSDGTPRILVPRASKAKSLQPPSRHNTAPAAVTPTGTPDRTRSSSFASKSPIRPNGRQASTTPSSSAAKRASVMPGLPASNSHASGLGARTVSPTDARRLKRLSMLQGVPPMPHAPPEGSLQAAMAARAPSSSPGPKTNASTPSSLRTTPDLSRRSYIATSNGNPSGFTPRSSTQSLQPRLSQMPSMSRLPTPKTRNPPSSNDDEDNPPPVPAIPKQYESPKEPPHDQSMFSLRKSHLPYDTSSLNSRNSSSTNEWSATSSGKERQIKVKSMGPLPRSSFMSGSKTDAEQKSKVTPVKKKQLQPLRLPPLNLLPLSTPTATKISQMTSDPSKQNGRLTPPTRVNAKTPSTPMTASKTSFFSSRHRAEQPTQASQSRSNTSTSQQAAGQGSPSKPIPAPARAPRQNAVSPFVSSSLPKSSGEHSFFGRSKPSVDSTHDSTTEARYGRVNGPRAQQKLTKSPKREVAPPRSPPKTDAEATGSSIRRKLSLSWKRGNSKSSITLVEKEPGGVPPAPPKHDTKYGEMPPPRLPASATAGSLNHYTSSRTPASKQTAPSPSESIKSGKSIKVTTTTNYLDTKRRKSSLSALDNSDTKTEEQKLQDKWGLSEQNTPAKPLVAERKLTALPTDTPKHTLANSRSSSAIVNSTNRILGPKPSTMSLRPSVERDRWTEGLDKDDLIAEEEIRRLAMRRKETETAARVLDALMKRATPKDRVTPRIALETAQLNIFERGEIVDFRDVYFCGTSNAEKHIGDSQSSTNNHGYDDERGDYGIVIGDHLSYRYEIIDVLGKGSFGQVVRCIDHKKGTLVAIKIIRNKKRFHQQALVEVDILQKLREWDPKGQHSLISFTSSFYFRGHLCISTELLSMNLYEFIKMNSFRGFSLRLIRRFTKQLLSSLLLLKRQRVIHCDLKPENILLTHPGHSEIKVIDFGSSCFEEQQVYTYIQSRFYRSPEVILGLEYGLPIDMWSVGCILAELFTGYPIFPGENETEQLACIMEVFGPPGPELIARSSRRKLFFDGRGQPRVSVSSKGRRRRVASKTLSQVLKCEDEAFLDFLTGCLRWDPNKRLKPEEGMLHPYITGRKPLTAARGARDRDSPVKRFNSMAVPPSAERGGGGRPLPMPPTGNAAGAGAGRAAASNRNMTEMGGASHRNPSSSPAKGAGRRISNMSFANPTLSNARKRESFGGNLTQLPGGGGLPRMRGASGQVKTGASTAGGSEMASAGASVAMGRK